MEAAAGETAASAFPMPTSCDPCPGKSHAVFNLLCSLAEPSVFGPGERYDTLVGGPMKAASSG
jgi:hypothetical protein